MVLAHSHVSPLNRRSTMPGQKLADEAVSRRPLVVTAVIAVLATLALLPLSKLQLNSSISFMPAVLSIVACFDVMSVYLLVGDFRDRGDVRLLMMSWAYAWSLVVMGGYALAFPGAISLDPPLALTPSMSPYYYVLWHGGFPVLLGAAWAPWPSQWTVPVAAARRRIVSLVTLTGAIASGLLVVAVFAALAHRLPVLIVGLDFTAMTRVTAPVTIPLVTLALAITIYGTWHREGPERWSVIAVLVCLCDLILTYSAGSRYSLGWYSGRTFTLASSAAVLIAMLAAFKRLKSRAELDAATDPLTELQNRRSADEALEQMFARCRRSGAPMGVLSLDLDFFKQVNDKFGHEAGDAVLIEVGKLLTRGCRRGDFAARVGGEEFLLLLADTDDLGTAVVAEKVRVLVAEMLVPTCDVQMTASVGATTLHVDDLTTATLLRRVDTALYEAKKTGRNRVVMAHAQADELAVLGSN